METKFFKTVSDGFESYHNNITDVLIEQVGRKPDFTNNWYIVIPSDVIVTYEFLRLKNELFRGVLQECKDYVKDYNRRYQGMKQLNQQH